MCNGIFVAVSSHYSCRYLGLYACCRRCNDICFGEITWASHSSILSPWVLKVCFFLLFNELPDLLRILKVDTFSIFRVVVVISYDVWILKSFDEALVLCGRLGFRIDWGSWSFWWAAFVNSTAHSRVLGMDGYAWDSSKYRLKFKGEKISMLGKWPFLRIEVNIEYCWMHQGKFEGQCGPLACFVGKLGSSQKKNRTYLQDSSRRTRKSWSFEKFDWEIREARKLQISTWPCASLF